LKRELLVCVFAKVADPDRGKPKADHSAKYFSHSDEQASKVREQLAEESLESLISWLKSEGNVGIMGKLYEPCGVWIQAEMLDATNSTFDRRRWVRERVAKEPGLQVLFLESYCDDPAIIATNVALKVQSGDPDYKDMTKAEAEADFRKRIAAYESVYQTISEPEISFCRILNVGRQVTINRIEGYLQSRIAFYLMNLHLKPRNIYLSRVS
jgi:6-phosphofructo-2-kinase/fructose-2,6-biphosphatase 2